ncbi:DNA glycosylase AlkZ-like family protein, partial [Actinoplanes sp. NPDC026623]|uniref:DNA glycosylase AlkZ-like family protein n=1 Tax=Actinoplanes sp. NPDC026623 TaxID=3155610 RepID=UPI0033EBEDA8
MTVLGVRALNRATLARQLLLERADLPVLDAVGHLCGLQAQEPQEPFVGLWSRLRAFDPAVLSQLLVRREVVRTHLMRRTVHLLAAGDVLAWRSRHGLMLRRRVLGVYRRELEGVDLGELAAAGRAVLADGEPRTMSELARAVAGRWPQPGTRALGEMLIGALIPAVQLPPRGVWRARAGARYLPVSAWLGREVDPPAPDGTDPVGAEL